MVTRRQEPQMAREAYVSCFPVTANTYFVRVRDDLLAIAERFHTCAEDEVKPRRIATQERCMAWILEVLIHWTDDRLKKQNPTWINLTLDQWVKECRDFFQRDVVRSALRCLAKVGVVAALDYSSAHGGKPFKQYKLNVDALKKWAHHTPAEGVDDSRNPDGGSPPDAPANAEKSTQKPAQVTPSNVDKSTATGTNSVQATSINQHCNTDISTLSAGDLSLSNVDISTHPIYTPDSSLDDDSNFEGSGPSTVQKEDKRETPPPSKPQWLPPLPAVIEQLTDDLTRELGDNPESAKSNRTRITRIYYAIIALCPANTDQDIYRFFRERKYKVMEYTNIRHRNKAGQPNRMPAFFDRVLRDLQFLLQLTEEELTALQAGAYLSAQKTEGALT